MKNFPHQHNQFSKLRATLEAIRDLEASGKDSSDDGVLGDELARRQIHRFRDLDYSDPTDLDQRVDAQLIEEHKKSASSQGTRTAARENRKTLRHLSWLEPQSSTVTAAGEALLASTPGSAEELAIIRPAVTQISVIDADGDTSHPVKILLRLIGAGHFDSHDGMELALEAKDDSESEYERVDGLAQLSPDDRRDRLLDSGATVNKIANAKKILPAFAESAGLIFQSGDGTFELTEVGRDAIQAGPVPQAGASKGGTQRRRSGKRRRTVTSATDRSKIGQSRRQDAAQRRALTGDEQQAAAELLYERTENHQALVRNTVAHCAGEPTFSEDAASFDLLVEDGKANPVDLIEAKTIGEDAHSQIRNAVGQLLDYEYFIVAPAHPGQTITKSVVVDEPVSQELADFLDAQGIGLFHVTKDSVTPLNEVAREIGTRLFGIE